MAVQKGRYYALPHLDSINQPTLSCGDVNKLKIPLKSAVNICRQDDTNMEELLLLLTSTLDHINQLEVQRKKTRTTQRPRKKSHIPVPTE